jgi:hypothetical protein
MMRKMQLSLQGAQQLVSPGLEGGTQSRPESVTRPWNQKPHRRNLFHFVLFQSRWALHIIGDSGMARSHEAPLEAGSSEELGEEEGGGDVADNRKRRFAVSGASARGPGGHT